jgi:hypothetical protein
MMVRLHFSSTFIWTFFTLIPWMVTTNSIRVYNCNTFKNMTLVNSIHSNFIAKK